MLIDADTRLGLGPLNGGEQDRNCTGAFKLFGSLYRASLAGPAHLWVPVLSPLQLQAPTRLRAVFGAMHNLAGRAKPDSLAQRGSHPGAAAAAAACWRRLGIWGWEITWAGQMGWMGPARWGPGLPWRMGRG